MTERDVSELKQATVEIKKLLGELITEFRVHVAVELERVEERERTCPRASQFDRMQADLNAVAGIVRNHTQFVDSHNERSMYRVRVVLGQVMGAAAAITVALILAKVFGI